MQQIFKYQQKQIFIHNLIEDGIPSYPNGWPAWSDRVKAYSAINILIQAWFSPVNRKIKSLRKYLHLDVVLVDPERTFFNVSATKSAPIHSNIEIYPERSASILCQNYRNFRRRKQR